MQRKDFLQNTLSLAAGIPFAKKLSFPRTSPNPPSPNLTKCYLTFAVPATSTGNEWQGENILLADVTIYLLDSSFYKAAQEHRNQPIGAGYAIFLPMPYNAAEMSKIHKDNIYEVVVALNAQGPNATPNCSFRCEPVLTFSDGSVIGCGYNDPAGSISPYIGVGHVSYTFRKPGFQNAPTLKPPY